MIPNAGFWRAFGHVQTVLAASAVLCFIYVATDYLESGRDTWAIFYVLAAMLVLQYADFWHRRWGMSLKDALTVPRSDGKAKPFEPQIRLRFSDGRSKCVVEVIAEVPVEGPDPNVSQQLHAFLDETLARFGYTPGTPRQDDASKAG